MKALSYTFYRRLLIASLLAASACVGESRTFNDGTGVGGSDNGSATGSGGHGGAEGGECSDECPAPSGGIEHVCQFRFMYGVNYAWRHFGGDFGGISAWSQGGVAAEATSYAKDLALMRANGASVIRWWVFPDFRGDGIDFDSSENPTGLGGTAEEDLKKALALAEEADVYLMLTLFSFDAFRPSQELSGVYTPGITNMVTSTEKRGMLLQNVDRPFAKIAEASPYKKRLIAWDVINEPEWAMTGTSPYGDEDYDPILETSPVTHEQMETFVGETIKVLREESSALVTVGSAGMKWAKAWSNVDVDFYQFHIYDWVNDYWPYTGSPEDYGVNDKPVVMGEIPLTGLKDAPYGKVVESFYTNGYAGALGWQHFEATAADFGELKAFADSHACETHY